MTFKQLKKGAMFGLDARIALAIFGALSVISGAALYSAIQDAKTVAFLSDLREVEKAVESYMLDTGENIQVTSDPAYGVDEEVLAIKELVSSSNSKANTPYLNYSTFSYDYHLSYPKFDKMSLNKRANIADTTGQLCTATSCFYIITMNNINEELKKAIDLKVDGILDENNGKVKYNSTHLFYFTDIPYK